MKRFRPLATAKPVDASSPLRGPLGRVCAIAYPALGPGMAKAETKVTTNNSHKLTVNE